MLFWSILHLKKNSNRTDYSKEQNDIKRSHYLDDHAPQTYL